MAFYINTGAVKVPLEDNLGRVIGHAVYVPTDFGILERYKAAAHYLDNIQKEFAKIKPEEVTAENALELMEVPKNLLKEFCNAVFGKDFYDEAFAQLNPFTFAGDDRFVCVQIIESVLNDIKDRQAKRAEKQDKYLAGYTNE